MSKQLLVLLISLCATSRRGHSLLSWQCGCFAFSLSLLNVSMWSCDRCALHLDVDAFLSSPCRDGWHCHLHTAQWHIHMSICSTAWLWCSQADTSCSGSAWGTMSASQLQRAMHAAQNKVAGGHVRSGPAAGTSVGGCEMQHAASRINPPCCCLLG